MSDDEDYYEWEEEYLLEDLVPDLVDELAQTSYYEAALYEDPGIDVEEYFSDWEYYSDDYHDDDPTVKQHPVVAKAVGAPAKTRRTQHGARTNNRVSRPQSSLVPDITSFQGVIWRTPNMETDQDIAVQIYEPGNGDKVALLENWREIFKSAQPALDKSRLRKRRTTDTPSVEPDLADDEFPCEDEEEDSSDQMSDILSLDHTTENGDAGDASNTTPELVQSPEEAPTPMETAPPKRGRKRKAEVPPEEPNKDNSRGDSTRTRTKRVASAKGDGKSARSDISSGPVRRSARPKK
ncbi:uncharacterized protein N7482_002509 [Penicillium canariense]|uniref:Uncharacterized protein n=1 Tax=Penicillium canariense TaxID=189055 RepID=A0A9W9IHP6_9EURO|nr:uncharacterized protein N7482_002509 [Penicillium canariense]KAJ5176632.1 hypothetical protein N7482_002509 [Penicillium canariense]